MNDLMKQYREEITGKLVEAMKTGTAPWQRPWRGSEGAQNAVSGRLYTGMNQVILSMAGNDIDGGKDPRWLTFKQASENGLKIKKGSKGRKVILWKPFCDEKDISKIVAVMQKTFTVFHATQIDGIKEYKAPEPNIFEAHEKAEKIISESGATIKFGGGRAFYSPSEDYIQLPKKTDFKSMEGYYSTALHELTHWTGHKSRLNRNIENGFGTVSYAYEELIAEMGSLFIASSAKIPQVEGEFQNHASYVESWLNHLKKEPDMLFKAAAQASKAADFLLKTGGESDEKTLVC